jgi:hypothetical protein
LGFKESDVAIWELGDGEARLTRRREQLHRAQALIRRHVPADVSLVDELVAERRAAASRE